MRSGLNLKLARKADQGLSIPQMLWAIVGIYWSYGITDPARYEPRVEAMHLLFAAIVMLTVSALAIRVGAMHERLQRQRAELALRTRQLRGAQPLLSVVLIDIDHFKRANDELGHAAGDEVLRRFAAAGQAVLRTGELLARWGGEEFLLVMPAADGQPALAAAMRLRERLRRHDFGDLRPGLVISFSAGVAECAAGDELDAAIARADTALYEAKRAGRDRVLLARETAGLAAPAG